MKSITAYGSIRSGVLTISHRDRFVKSLAGWPDCRVVVKVEKVYRKRSTPQNSYYWGVVINEFCDGYRETTGESCSPEDAHAYLKGRFNSKQVINERTGEVADIPQTTSTLTTSQFMDYQAECVRFIAEFFGRHCPEPGEQSEINFADSE